MNNEKEFTAEKAAASDMDKCGRMDNTDSKMADMYTKSLIMDAQNNDVVQNDIKMAELDKKKLKKHVYFEKYTIRDIVFLAIISAVTLVTSAVMPLVASVPIFGISQLVTGLQMSIFPAIGLMKVRKPGAIFIMSIFIGLIQLAMAFPMFLSSIFNGILLEALVFIIFRGYKKDSAVFFAAALLNPLSLPFNYLYNLAIGNELVTAIADSAPFYAVGMTAAVLAVTIIGALVGIKITKELKKSGVLKK